MRSSLICLLALTLILAGAVDAYCSPFYSPSASGASGKVISLAGLPTGGGLGLPATCGGILPPCPASGTTPSSGTTPATGTPTSSQNSGGATPSSTSSGGSATSSALCGAPIFTGEDASAGPCYIPNELSGPVSCAAPCTLSVTACTESSTGKSGSDYSCVLPPPCLTQSVSVSEGTISLALLALTLSFDVVAIAYVINKLFPTAGIRDWISTEYWEIAKTAMLIVGIYAVLIFLGNAATAIAPSGLVSPTAGAAASGYDFTGMTNLVNGACVYLDGEGALAGTSLNYIFGLSEATGFLKNTQILEAAVIPLPYVEILTGFNMQFYWNNMIASEVTTQPYASMLNDMVFMIMVPVTLAIEAQLTLLPILFVIGLGALIPLGLLLRAFPFVRGVGGTLIAIGVGVSLIYPATLVLFNYPITVALQGSAIPKPQVGATLLTAAKCNSDFLICGVGGIAFSLTESLFGVGGTDAVLSLQNIYPALNDMLYYSSYLLLQFFLFVLDLIIIFPLVDNIAKMLGGKISLNIGGRLKLI